MPLRVTNNIRNTKRLLEQANRKFKKEAKRTIVDIIVAKITSGVSPVSGYNRYPKYSEGYAKEKGRELPVDLTKSGKMLENMIAKETKNGIVIEFRGARNKKLATYHNYGLGNNPTRRILPTSREKFKKGIVDKIISTLRQAIRSTFKWFYNIGKIFNNKGSIRMSEEIMNEGSTQANANDENNLLKEIEQLRSTNERLLNESKSNKTRKSEFEELQAKLEGIEREKLEKEGRTQELIEMERKQRIEKEQELQSMRNKVLKSNVFNAVANYAKDAHDVNDLLAQSEYAKMIEVDEESLEPVGESVQNFVNSLKEKKKYLFKGHKVPSMADSKPPSDNPSPKYNSKEEMNKLIKEELAKSLIR